MRKFSLRPLEETDLETLFQHQLDPDTALKAGASHDPADRAAFERRMRQLMAAEPGEMALFVIEFQGEIAGSVGYFHRAGKMEVAYWLGPAFRGRGLATRALAALLERVPGGREPVYARVVDGNYESIRVLEKIGFESYARDRFFVEFRNAEVTETIFVLHRDREGLI